MPTPTPNAKHATLLSLCLIALLVTQACVHRPSIRVVFYGTSRSPIGTFTSVQGQGTVIHAHDPEPIAIRLDNGLLSEDIIETQQGSRAKAWLQDDTLLSVGEDSRLELSVHNYDQTWDKRSTVIRLTRGKVRALISRPLVGKLSKFEVQAETASVAARGTYFVVWLEEGSAEFPRGTTGVVNIGNQGSVAFTSGGQTAIVRPGQFSMALPKMPPTTPRVMELDALDEVSSAITGTEIKDIMTAEKPSEVVRAIGDGMNRGLGIPDSTSVGKSDEDDTPPAVISGAVSIAGQPGGTLVSGGAGTGASSASPGPIPTIPTTPGPSLIPSPEDSPTSPSSPEFPSTTSPVTSPLTPPAVISGAAPSVPTRSPLPSPVTSSPSAPSPVPPPAPSPSPVISPPPPPSPVLPPIPSPITGRLR